MATLDVISTAEAKTALNIPTADTTQDSELAVYATAVSLRLDALVGPIVNRTITGEVHDGGRSFIILRYSPVSSVTSVSERQGTTSYTVVTENYAASTSYDYLLDPLTGILYRRGSGGDVDWYGGRQNIVVTYVAGRFANTTSVDGRYKQAAAIMLTHLWRSEQGASGATFGEGPSNTFVPGFAVPNAVVELLADQLIAPAVA